MSRLSALFGLRLRALRIERGYSQEQLAEKASLSLNAVGLFERGRRFPRASSLDALIRALDVQPERFFEGLVWAAREPAESYGTSLSSLSPALRELVKMLSCRSERDQLWVLSIVRLLLAKEEDEQVPE